MPAARGGARAFEERLLLSRGQTRGMGAVETAGVFVREGGVDGGGSLSSSGTRCYQL
jgi:hypothetical protein